ncbi:hypothetical protein GCM10025734_05110 [Kitasatospora paranensis]
MSLASAMDTAQVRSVVLWHGSPGLRARGRLASWPAGPPRMDGKVVLVTGAAPGTGRAAVAGFARRGARVRGLARDRAGHGPSR